MAAPTHAFAFPFSTKVQIESERLPEEVPLQEIVCQNPQNFTRKDFDQAKREHKLNEKEGIKYPVSLCPEQKNKEETKKKLPIVMEDQKQSLAFISPQKPIKLNSEERSPIQLNVEHLKPQKEQKGATMSEEDLLDENASHLLRYYIH